MEKKKRVRSANFNSEGVRLLIRLALKNKNVLENKKTDSEMWKLKTSTWANITELFNASSGQAVRTVEDLRLKYECLKKELKKKVNKNKAVALKTGGGVPDYISIEGPEKKLLEALSFRVHGCPSNGDSDKVLPQTTLTGQKADECTSLEEGTIAPVMGEAECLSPDMEDELSRIAPEDDVYNYTVDPVVITMTDTSPEDAGEGCSWSHQEDTTSSTPNNIIEVKKAHSWKDWTPAKLRTRKHPILSGKNKKEDINKKVANLLDLREELVKKQISAHDKTEKRHEATEKRQQEEHEAEMRILRYEEEIKKKQLKQLDIK